jgi:hypothetical protein
VAIRKNGRLRLNKGQLAQWGCFEDLHWRRVQFVALSPKPLSIRLFNPVLRNLAEVGDYGFASKKTAHFASSRTDTIIQVHGIGPLYHAMDSARIRAYCVVPVKEFPRLAMDKRYETVWGDPAKAGSPFVIRIHAEAGYIIMPHTHPEDENIVVVKGMGDHFNRE